MLALVAPDACKELKQLFPGPETEEFEEFPDDDGRVRCPLRHLVLGPLYVRTGIQRPEWGVGAFVRENWHPET